VGGVIGGCLGGLGGTLIYIELLGVYEEFLPASMGASAEAVLPIAVGIAGIIAIGMFLVNAVIAAYNITGTIEGPHDPKFKRFPRAIVGCAVASAICGLLAIILAVV
jgi:tetrahydromethanopterin S-methyltransferase subunit D